MTTVRAIGRDVELLLGQRRPGRRRQVDRVADAFLPARDRRGVQVPLTRAVERVPVPDRECVEEEGLDPRLLARRVPLTIGGRIGAAGEDGCRVHDHIRVACGDDRIDTARRGRQQPRLAAVGGEQPEATWLVVIAAVVG